jgi:hypothetical protein
MAVGGVRIEDDLLITPKGYENLTTAPKGDAMLEIIRQGISIGIPSASLKPSLRARISEEEPPRLRAPGISTDKPESILRPIARAATMPAEYKQHKSVDFEPFEGPSLFSNFKRSMTTDEKIQRWQQDRDSALMSKGQPVTPTHFPTICGTDLQGVKHVHMTSGSHRPIPLYNGYLQSALPVCKKCTILCEALDRLRQNLALSEQSSPKQEHATVHCSVSPTSGNQTNHGLADQTFFDQRKGRGLNQPARDVRQPSVPSPTHDERMPRFQRTPDRTSNHVQQLEHGLEKLFLEQRRHSQEQLSHAERDHSRQVHPLSEAHLTQRKRDSTSEALESQNSPKNPYPCQLRQQADRIHSEARHAFGFQSRLETEQEARARARQTLDDLIKQRRSNTGTERPICQLSDVPTAVDRSQADIPKPAVERRNQNRGHTEDLADQLRTYVRSYRPAERPSQLEQAKSLEG